MPRVRYTDGPDEVTVYPTGGPQFVAKRGEWAEVEQAALAKQLVAQGWESESTKARSAKSERE